MNDILISLALFCAIALLVLVTVVVPASTIVLGSYLALRDVWQRLKVSWGSRPTP